MNDPGTHEACEITFMITRAHVLSDTLPGINCCSYCPVPFSRHLTRNALHAT